MRRTIRIVVVSALLSATLLIGIGSPASAGEKGATQISGTIDTTRECTNGPGDWATADYAFAIQGDLNGCVYGLVTSFLCTPSGVYRERADEIFVSDTGAGDTFQMTENFRAKFDWTPCDFTSITYQYYGGCKHPIVSGSGTGIYDGVSGRLDFKDIIVDGVNLGADYRGHLKGL